MNDAQGHPIPTEDTKDDEEVPTAVNRQDDAALDEEDSDEEIELEPSDRPRTPPPGIDLDLIRRAKEGDSAAFETIYRTWNRRIYNLVYQYVGNESDAVDLTQDVFVKLYESLPTLRVDEAFVAFLYRMAINLCRDHYRKRGRVVIESIDQPRSPDDDENAGFDIPDTSGDPQRAVETAELQRRVQDAIRTLSEDHRTVIVLHHFHGMELSEIATIMGCREGTVKSRLARARDEMKRKLRSYFGV